MTASDTMRLPVADPFQVPLRVTGSGSGSGSVGAVGLALWQAAASTMPHMTSARRRFLFLIMIRSVLFRA